MIEYIKVDKLPGSTFSPTRRLVGNSKSVHSKFQIFHNENVLSTSTTLGTVNLLGQYVLSDLYLVVHLKCCMVCANK